MCTGLPLSHTTKIDKQAAVAIATPSGTDRNVKRVAVEITRRVIVRNRRQVSVVWEYMVEQFAYSDELIQGLLTALGREGWECVGPLPGHPAVGNAGFRMLFKRPQVGVHLAPEHNGDYSCHNEDREHEYHCVYCGNAPRAISNE